MEKCPHNKNVSTIKTNLVDTGIEEDLASLVASTLVSSTTDNDTSPSAGNCHTDTDNIRQSTPIIMVHMKDEVIHEVEETVITNFLQFALLDNEYHQSEDTNP